jgi:hypothetical protein
MTTRNGGCACGAVRYEISAEPVFQVACHCRACQYASGGAPTLAKIVPKDALKITKGEPRFYWSAGESGAQVGRGFCESCGSPLYSLPEANAGIAVIKVGNVQADIWTSAAQPWHRLHEGAAKFEKTPMPGG